MHSRTTDEWPEEGKKKESEEWNREEGRRNECQYLHTIRTYALIIILLAVGSAVPHYVDIDAF